MSDLKYPSGAPKVFISSTVSDLKEYRDKAKSAANRAGFLPIMNEDWSAKAAPPLDECMERVDGTHLTIAIVAHRYGWVPVGQEDEKSITRLECERTVADSIPRQLLVFVVDDEAAWPVEKKEDFRTTQASMENKSDDEIFALLKEVKRNKAKLQAFKTWLTQDRICNTFQSPEELERKVESALKDWLANNPSFAPQAKEFAKSQANPDRYLAYWYEFCAKIDIRGLHVGSGKAHSFPIADLYIELDTSGGGKLKHTLAHIRRVVVGDPGSGKTTFLRWIVHLLAGDRLGISDHSAEQRLGLSRPLMPVFVSIAEWLEYVYKLRERKQGPTMPKDPQWLVHFLNAQAASREWGLDADWFRKRLNVGECLLLFDGLDEAPDRKAREFATELLEAVAATWLKCPILVTSRPSGYEDRTVLPNFEPSHIETLNDAAVGTFLDRWSSALHPTDTKAAANHRQELLQALNARPNIRRLARNTVMLTALAVVHWNEKRLPEQRAELYESILLWLARSRELRHGRAGAERSLEILRKLALSMHDAKEGRKIQVTRYWAAEQIANLFPDEQAYNNPMRPTRFAKPSRSIELAEKFLEEEELDSGIIVRRGNELRFWHLSFQEYLAARAIGGYNEQEQLNLILGKSKRLYQPEWREVVQLLGGVLYEQGREKVDGLVKAVLDALYETEKPLTPAERVLRKRGSTSQQSNLADQARAVGLLVGIVRDLAPFNYEPRDVRYRQTLATVTDMFTPEGSKPFPIELRIAAAEALGLAGDPRLADESLRWVSIPAGTFLMGAQQQDQKAPNYNPMARDNETPQTLELSGFHIGRWPVTVQDYALFIEDDGYAEHIWWLKIFDEWQNPKDWQQQTEHPNRPVVGVSWYEAMAYAAWLTDHLHRVRKLANDQVIRLPTETEWEYAARGSSARRYAWGDTEPSAELANYAGNVGAPSPVGVYPLGATPEGVQEISGNVREWCLNLYDNKVPKPGVIGQKDLNRTYRGGSWIDRAGLIRCAFRNWNLPGNRSNDLGFRLVLGSPW